MRYHVSAFGTAGVDPETTPHFCLRTLFKDRAEMCHNVDKRMDEMSKSAKPWFSTARSADLNSAPLVRRRAKRVREQSNLEAADEAANDPRGQIRDALRRGGRRFVLPEFVKELHRLLQEQEAVLKLIDSKATWALPVLNRQYFAIRSAADVLDLSHLAHVASRAEVLANLLDTGVLPFSSAHGDILVHTHGLLKELVLHIAKRGSDQGCYSIAQTASWLYSTLDPALGDYEPGPAKPASHLQ